MSEVVVGEVVEVVDGIVVVEVAVVVVVGVCVGIEVVRGVLVVCVVVVEVEVVGVVVFEVVGVMCGLLMPPGHPSLEEGALWRVSLRRGASRSVLLPTAVCARSTTGLVLPSSSSCCVCFFCVLSPP